MKRYSHSYYIFPPSKPLPQVLDRPRLRGDVLIQLREDPACFRTFSALSPEEQEAFLGFCEGTRGLKATYDPFFLRLFDPVQHPERLERLLSCVLGQQVRVVMVLPRERRRPSENSSLVIMDILVSLADGRLVDVEMQRIGYDFPIERGFCYGADLMVRQYDMVREDRGSAFSYRDIKPVYIIVLMEQSPALFHQYPGHYIHRSNFSFDTGLKLKPLQNFIYIPLDIFRRMPHNELTELEAWLYFLGSDDPADILRITEKYPLFEELYRDIVSFRFQPKELIAMYSEALHMMDKNTIQYMVDEMRAEMEQMNMEMKQMNTEMKQMDTKISFQESEIARQKEALAQKEAELAQLRARLAQSQEQ